MTFIPSLIHGKRAPLFSGVIAFVYFAVIGFRGFGTSGLQWLERATELAVGLAESTSSVRNWSAEPQIGVDIFGALILLITPGPPQAGLFWISILAGSMTTAFVFSASRRLAGPIGGWVSLFFVLTCAPWMGLFTRADPTSILAPLFLGFILIWHSRRPWWIRSLLGAPTLFAAILIWPAAILLPALLLAVDLLVPIMSRKPEAPGLVAAPTITFDRITTPLLIFVLLMLCPLFWPAPLESLGTYFMTALEVPAQTLVFRGEVYAPSRPPLLFGLAWIFEQLPLMLVFVLVAGILFSLKRRDLEEHRFAIALAVIATAMLTLPVIFRGPRPMGAEYGVLFLAAGLPLASMVTCRFFSMALSPDAPSLWLRQVAVGAYFLAGASILLQTSTAMFLPEAHRSPLTSRVVGWSVEGDLPLREDILPVHLMREVVGDDDVLFTGGWEEFIQAYRAMGLLDDIRTTADPETATLAIRRMPAIIVSPRSTFDADFQSPLPKSQTTAVPDRNRPVFLIDRRIEGSLR